MKLGCGGKVNDPYDEYLDEVRRKYDHEQEKKRALDDMYGGINNRCVEVSGFHPTGPIKSVAARTPYNDMLKEYEREESEMKKKRYINGYTDFELGSPACAPGELEYGAKFKLDRDITDLFPYINAVSTAPKYRKNPHSIVLLLDGIKCAFYTDHQVVARFDGEASARKFIRRLIDYLNDIYEKKDSIEPKHKEYKPIPALSIFKLLPKTNCRKCEYASCMAFAAALSKAEVSLDQCTSLKGHADDNTEKLISLLSQ